MKVTITGKNIEVSEYLRDLALKKIAKLERYFPEDTEVLITMAVEKNRHIVEVTIPYQGGIIRGEESTGDMYASIDNVIAKLEKQIHRHKTRLEKSLRYDDYGKSWESEFTRNAKKLIAERCLGEFAPDGGTEEQKYMLAFAVNGCFGTIVAWQEAGFQPPAAEIARITWQAIRAVKGRM